MLSQGHILDGMRQLKAALPGMWTAHSKYTAINSECFPDVYVDSIISNFIGNELFDAIRSSIQGVINDYSYRPYYNGIAVNVVYDRGSVNFLEEDYRNLESNLKEISGEGCEVTVDTFFLPDPDRIMLDIRIKLDNMTKLYEKANKILTDTIDSLDFNVPPEDLDDLRHILFTKLK